MFRETIVTCIVAFALLASECDCFTSFSWSYNAETRLLEMEISAIFPDPGDDYLAVAFAKNPKMEAAEGYYCYGNEIRPFEIHNQHEPPIEIEDPEIQLVAVTGMYTMKTCKFTRPVRVTRKIDDENYHDFDFSKDGYYVLMALGKIEDGSIGYHTYRQVDDDPTEFPSAISLAIRGEEHPEYGCDVDKHCFRYPDGCKANSPACMFVSFKQDEDDIVFELSGGHGNGDEYIGVAFSKDKLMGDDDLYYCTGRKLQAGVIREKGKRPHDVISHSGLIVEKAITYEGVAHCKFSRSACVTQIVSDGKNETFDLLRNPVYILIAIGKIEDGMLRYHDSERIHSAAPILVGNVTLSSGEYKCAHAKTNGSIGSEGSKGSGLSKESGGSKGSEGSVVQPLLYSLLISVALASLNVL